MTSPQQVAEATRDAMWKDDRASRMLGIEVLAIGPGTATLAMTVREDMLNGHDICHGGLVTTLADSAFASSVIASAKSSGIAASITRRVSASAWLGIAARRFASAITLEANAQSELGRAHDFAEGVAAFFAKRPPVFKDR